MIIEVQLVVRSIVKQIKEGEFDSYWRSVQHTMDLIVD